MKSARISIKKFAVFYIWILNSYSLSAILNQSLQEIAQSEEDWYMINIQVKIYIFEGIF